MIYLVLLFVLFFLWYLPWIIDQLLEYFLYYPIHYGENYHTGDAITTENGDIVPFLVIRPKGMKNPKKCIIFSHGNNSTLLNWFDYWDWLTDSLGVCVIVYDYIGYGISKGKPSEQKCYESLEYIVGYALFELHYEPEQIYLIGHSLGTAVVVHYASTRNWTTPIMLVSPCKSAISAKINANLNFPFDKFNSYSKIKNIKCPVKIVHGTDDASIPFFHGKELYNALPGKKLKPIWLSNTGHCGVLENLTISDYADLLEYNK